MNIKAVKKHILERIAHGKPIQTILDPPIPQIEVIDYTTEPESNRLVDDPDYVRPDLPDWNIVVQWLGDDEEFRNAYDHAMKYGAVYLADELLILKDALLKDPRNATAYKAAMDAIRTSAMWRDPKYSERTIQEVKNTQPQDADTVRARIKQLEQELGLDAQVVDVEVVEVVKPQISERMRLHLEGARAKRREKIAERRKQNGHE